MVHVIQVVHLCTQSTCSETTAIDVQRTRAATHARETIILASIIGFIDRSAHDAGSRNGGQAGLKTSISIKLERNRADPHPTGAKQKQSKAKITHA